MIKILVPNNFNLGELQLQGAEFLGFDLREDIPEAHRDAEMLVVLGLNKKRLQHAIDVLPRLKIIQTLTAGVDNVLSLSLPENVVLYRAPGVHEEPVVEHTLALILGVTRQLHLSRDKQKQHFWDFHDRYTSLRGKNVTIWGYGSIGQQLAEVLRVLGANVWGVARSSRAGVYGTEHLPELLPHSDHVVLILPSTPHTHKALNSQYLAMFKPSAWLFNVGRGDAVCHDDLLTALQHGQLAGAALDVTHPEPLPAEHPLWDMENVVITPHVASQSDRLFARMREFLLENTAKFVAGQEGKGKVDFTRGY